MSNKYIVRFCFDEKDHIQVPIKAIDVQALSESIVSALNESTYLSLPTKEGIRKIESTTIFLQHVRYFQIEKPTKGMLERYLEEDFVALDTIAVR